MRSTEQSANPTCASHHAASSAEMLVDLLPELRGGTDAVLAGDDVQRLPDACGAARGDAFGDGRGDEGQDAQPDGRGDDLGAHDLVDDLPAARIDTRNITDPHVAALHVHDMHGVSAVLVDAVDDLHVHIGENHMVPPPRRVPHR